jgi:cytochrome P450 family 110
MSTALQPHSLPPGPRLPQFLQTAQLVRAPLSMATRCQAKYGDRFTLRIAGDRTYVVLSNPTDVREILSNADLDVGNEELRPMLGDSSLLVLNGEAHRRHRKMLAPAFRGDGLRSHREMIRQIATDHQECLPQESTIRVYPFVQSLCLDIIVRVVFGDCGDALERLKRETGDLIESVTAPMVYIPVLQWDLGPGSPGRKIQTKLRNLDRSIQAEVSTRRAGGSNGRGGILDHLLLERDDDGEPLTDTEIRDEVITLMMAGHEPTTAAIAWALYWIHSDMAVANRLRDELSGTVEPSDVLQNRYLDLVCREVLRIIPVVPAVERCSNKEVPIGDCVIPPGVSIVPCIYLLHQRPELYPDPSTFRPERFLDRKYSAFEFIPFGGGSRACVGKSMAPEQMKIVIATLLKRFEFRLAPGSETIEPFTRGTVIRPHSSFSLTTIRST